MAARRKKKSGLPSWIRDLGGTFLHLAAETPELQGVRGASAQVSKQLAQWFAHLSRNAVGAWGPALLSETACDFCEAHAIGACAGCGGPVCLAHAAVTYRAELVCDECLGKVLDSDQPDMPFTRPSERKRSEAPPRPPTPEEEAYAYFNLRKGVTYEEVTAVYRVRARGCHPDSGGSDARMKELNRHYTVLEVALGKRAA